MSTFTFKANIELDVKLPMINLRSQEYEVRSICFRNIPN